MNSDRTLTIHNTTYDCSQAVSYHLGAFPPPNIPLDRIIEPLTGALQDLTRFDERLAHMPNSELLLAPLRQRDAVVSSRMEGTISTLEEVLRLEAGKNARHADFGGRDDTLEVALYARALKAAEEQIDDGYGLSDHLIRTAHQIMLSHGRGADKNPGKYKVEQNYVGDRHQRRVDFVPIAPEHLGAGMQALVAFVTTDGQHPLIRTAIAHAEFEALHPFDDGNGRIGRMLIPLTLWNLGILAKPHFFVSDYFERHKDEYVARLRAVSAHGDWTGWCGFFLTALKAQAVANMRLADAILAHHAQMNERFRQILRSQHYGAAVDFMFANPIFWNNHFLETANAPRTTLQNYTPKLVEAGLLRTLVPPAGRAPGLYAFSSLLEIIDAGE